MTFLSLWSFVLLLASYPAAILAQLPKSLGPLPLEVRSPYLNVWVTPPRNWDIASGSVSGFNNGQSFLHDGFPNQTALIRVDGVAYSMFGDSSHPNGTNLQAVLVTPTRTIFSFSIGPVEVNATFFSPIEPGDLLRQSLPFSYLYFNVASKGGSEHDIQIYASIDAATLFAADSQNFTWTTATKGESIYHAVEPQDQIVFSEDIEGRPRWGTAYFATEAVDATFIVGSGASAIGTFSAQDTLQRLQDSQTGQVETNSSTNASPSFALVRDLGTIVATTSPVVFAIGLIQDPVVLYNTLSGVNEDRIPYYRANYTDDADLINDFLSDFPGALTRAIALEAKIQSDAADAAFFPNDYMGLVSFSARLVYASIVITVTPGLEGRVDTSSAMAFLRNLGTDTRINVVDTLFAAFPMFMYLDPKLGALLLEPLLASETGLSMPYAMMDLGDKYPNATAGGIIHNKGLEESADMVIMVYAYARATGNGSLIQRYYDPLKRWGEYLIQETLYTQGQTSADGLNTDNQANLAFKGIVALRAMAEMSAAVGQFSDSKTFGDTSAVYFNIWETLALGSDQHLLATYGDQSSWSLGYNYFADLWLQTHILSKATFDAQLDFLSNTKVSGTFDVANVGVALDSFRPSNVTTSWNIFAAASANQNKAIQNSIISGLHGHTGWNQLIVSSGGESVFSQSPALGAIFAPLTLSSGPFLPIQLVDSSTPSADRPSSKVKKIAGALGELAAGGVIAGVVVLGLIVLRRRQHSAQATLANVTWVPRVFKLELLPSSKSRTSMNSYTSSKPEKQEKAWKNLEDYEFEDI
ncbi:hypothetical protein BC834DRAFT_870190 [Gloeopeniophorella convolvens]|nr:hypothetical protein BC834DRAFT_870190 [Gloeopeniophorella convolvens]